MAKDGVVGQRTLGTWRVARETIGLPDDHPITTAAQLNVRRPWTRSPAARRRAGQRAMNPGAGARAMVERAVKLVELMHPALYVVSAFRPGDPMDHGSNDWDKAARDVAYPGRDALKGPPHRDLDDAAVIIGRAFGRKYEWAEPSVDTHHWNGWRVQVIWRVPAYGGHLGHVHLGIHRL